ncbi:MULTISPECIES: response regulator [unclassified Methylobacterium]|uniref:response regulator n=1 Tax=unclassified Methylobacterium TaxID=2615210 RepID=UPI0006F63165|nr:MULTISPECIES: response regulator [unclassified Methylobacterium]KQP13512.1 histidine kinase [Methylobacterium sp. Leaf93]
MPLPDTADAPHVLVVDDDALILMDVSDILEDAGFVVLEAMNVAQAMRVLDEHHGKVQLLFTDVQMPGPDNGFDLARRTAVTWPHIAIVVASGNVRPEPGDLPDGATFIGKPFSPSLVRHHVRETMPPEKHPGPLRR